MRGRANKATSAHKGELDRLEPKLDEEEDELAEMADDFSELGLISAELRVSLYSWGGGWLESGGEGCNV